MTDVSRWLGDSSDDDPRLLRLGGLALIVAVWVLGVFAPRQGGTSHEYLAVFTGLLLGLAVVEQTAPPQASPLWRRLAWLGAELVLCYYVVDVHGTLIRPALIYLVPASRAILMFGERGGLALSLSVWLAYGVNTTLDVWPSRLDDYPNYLSFFLPLYVVAVVLTLATVRQAADRRRVQGLYDELRAAHAELQQLHQRAREATVTEERNRLAREIHDTLAHYLTVINLQLEAAEKLGDGEPARALEQVRRARRLTVECLQEVRRSVAALRASTLEELSLPGALSRLAAEFAEHTGTAVQVEMNMPEDVRLPPEVALALYRVAQEGLTNVYRHAHARAVRLSLARRDGDVELVVQDDGTGPGDEHGNGNGSGFGLLGLRERVALLGRRLGFGPGPSGGSRLAVTLPLVEAHERNAAPASA